MWGLRGEFKTKKEELQAEHLTTTYQNSRTVCSKSKMYKSDCKNVFYSLSFWKKCLIGKRVGQPTTWKTGHWTTTALPNFDQL